LRGATPFAILTLLGLIFFAPLVAHPGDLFYSDHSDFLALELPAVHFQVESYRATGELPKWCPHAFAGEVFAFVPSPHMAPFVLTDIVPHGAFGPLLCWMVVLHIIIAGSGMYVYAREEKLSETAALVAACGFMFGGAWLLHILAGGHFFVGLAWLPFVLLYLQRAMRQRSVTAATIAALFYALLVWTLHPQIAFYAGLFIGLWLMRTAYEEGYLGGTAPVSSAGALRAVGICIGLGLWTAVLGIALAGMYLLPAFTSTEGSTRGAGISAADLLELGRITLFNLVGPSVQQQPRWEETGGLGLIVLALAASAPLLNPSTRVRYQAMVCAGLMVFGIGGALLVQGLPGVNMFRQPARMFVVVGFPVAYLAGVAVDALCARPGPAEEKRGLARFMLVALAVVIAVFVYSWSVQSHRDGHALEARPYWFTLAITLPATLWLLGAPGISPQWLSRSLVAVVLIDLWALSWPEVRTRPETQVFPISSSVAYLAEHRNELGRVLDVDQRPEAGTRISDEDKERDTPRMSCSPLGRGAPLALTLGIHPLRGYNPIDIARYKMFLQFLGDSDRPLVALRDHLAFPIVCNVPVRNESLLDLLGTRYLLMPEDMVPPAGWHKVLDDPTPRAFDVTTGGIRDLRANVLYENPRAWSRVFVASGVEVLDEDATLEQLKRTNFRRTALLEGTLPELPTEPRSESSRTATITRYTPNEVVVHCEAGEPGILVLSDPWHGAWTCTVNGSAVRVSRANYAFRGVALPATACDVVFRFAPVSYRRGAWLTGGALVVVGLVLLCSAVRRVRSSHHKHLPECSAFR
jgi:hypothetical protein